MTTAEELKKAKGILDNNIKKLLEEFINQYGQMYLTTEAHTHFSGVDHFDKMYSYSNTEIKIL